MNNRERELMELMTNRCFYHTLREHIQEFLKSYKRLKYIENHVIVFNKVRRYKIELAYFYSKYFDIRAYQSLYRFCKIDRKIRKKKNIEWGYNEAYM